MLNVTEIIAKNNATFYDYRTNERQRVWPRWAVFIVLSLASAIFVRAEETEFLNGIITIQAILIGFSFSVMFFLVSKEKEKPSDDSIEAEAMTDRLQTLSKEIFYNIGYFNLTAVACLACALALLVRLKAFDFAPWTPETLKTIQTMALVICMYAGQVLSTIVHFVLTLTLLESAYTFVRTVDRINFLFEEKMKSD